MWVSDWLAAVDARFMYGVLFLKEFQQNVVYKTELPLQIWLMLSDYLYGEFSVNL